MKFDPKIIEFCEEWFEANGIIGPLLLMRKFKITLDYAKKIIEYLGYERK